MGSFFSSRASGEESDVVKPKGINLSDPYAVKRLLDDSASEIIMGRGYQEDPTLNNLKIVLGFITCSVALTAQFYPKKFPENQGVLIVCIVIYVLLNLILQYLAYFKERNHILITRPRVGAFMQTGLAVSTKLTRFSDLYTLRVASSEPKSKAAHEPVELTKSVTKWITTEGTLADEIFGEDIRKLLEDYEEDRRKTE